MPAMTLENLAEMTGSRLAGDGSAIIRGVGTLLDAGPDDIAYLTNSRYRKNLSSTQAGAVILDEASAEECPTNALISDNPYLCYALIAELLFPPRETEAGIHSSAVIGRSAAIDESATIGPQVVIENDVVIEESVFIGPGCVVMQGSRIGAGSRLLSGVTVMHDVIIGRSCLLHPGVVVGCDGFGLASSKGTWVKVPQLGTVLIGNDVEIGANTTIDRGSLRNTVIGDGVKLDNQIQIAHNVEIGNHTAIAACVGIAGSSTIGSHCTIGGMAGIVGHIEIADDTHIAAKTLVTRSISLPGSYSGGLPASSTGSWRRIIGRIRHIDELFQRVKALEKREK